jgi:hypothetical protein
VLAWRLNGGAGQVWRAEQACGVERSLGGRWRAGRRSNRAGGELGRGRHLAEPVGDGGEQEHVRRELLSSGGWCAAELAEGRVMEQDESEASEGKGEARRSGSMRKQEQARWRNEQRGRAAWAVDGVHWQDGFSQTVGRL